VKKVLMLIMTICAVTAAVHAQGEIAQKPPEQIPVQEQAAQEPVSQQPPVQEPIAQEPPVQGPAAQEPAAQVLPVQEPAAQREEVTAQEVQAAEQKPAEPVVQEQVAPAAPIVQETIAQPKPPQAAAQKSAEPVIQEQVAPAAPIVQETIAQPKPPQIAAQQPASSPQNAKKTKNGIKLSLGGGFLFESGFGGGITTTAEDITMPYTGYGGHLFFDAHYAALTLGFFTGGGELENQNSDPTGALPEKLERMSLNIELYAKYPISIGSSGNTKFFPTAGAGYELTLSGKYKFANGDEIPFDGGYEDLGPNIGSYKRPDADALDALWFKFGCGFDIGMGDRAYLRTELLYGFRMANKLEEKWIEGDSDGETKTGHGLTVKAGVGFKF